jgi:hypothetical protein
MDEVQQTSVSSGEELGGGVLVLSARGKDQGGVGGERGVD